MNTSFPRTALLLCLIGCSGEDPSQTSPRESRESSVESRESPVESAGSETSPGEASGEEAPGEQQSPEEAPAFAAPTVDEEVTAPDVVFGDIRQIDGAEEDDFYRALLVEIEPRRQPAGPAAARIEVHSGEWEIRSLGEKPSPYALVSVIDSEPCSAPVLHARELHARERLYGYEEERSRSWTFLALEIDQCSGGMGVAGAAVRVHSLERDEMRVPATPELVSLVRRLDEDLGWASPLPMSEYRMRRLRRNLHVVVGNAAWLVRGQEVLEEQFHGFPIVAVEAGDELFFEMSAPTESWAAKLADFSPRSAFCIVADDSGTPLNVRRAPGHSEVIRTLPNSTHVRSVESRGSWRRLAEHGWVHESGLRCTL